MTGELRRRLEAMGSLDAPNPGTAYVERTAARLVDLHRQGAAGESGRRVPAPATRWPTVALGAAAAVLAAAAAGLLVRRPEPEVAVTAAHGAEVVLPGGQVVPAHPGQRLPDGAVVRTGPQGSARVGGVAVGPGAAVVNDDGRARPVDPPPSTTTSAPARSTTVPPTRPAPTTAPPGRPTPTGTAWVPPRATMRLAARRFDGRAVGLQWSQHAPPGFSRYVLVRRRGAEPSYPPGDGTEVVAEISDPAGTRYLDEAPGADPVYRVVALDVAGRVIAGSPAVRPA